MGNAESTIYDGRWACDEPLNSSEYYREILADTLGEPEPSAEEHTDDAETIMKTMSQLAVKGHEKDTPEEVARAYDAGKGMGCINYSETMRFMENRIEDTDIKAISFGEADNMPRLYADGVAIASGIQGAKYDKCMELLNVMSEADIASKLSVVDNKPQYILLARISPYDDIAQRYPIYGKLKALATDSRNHVICSR